MKKVSILLVVMLILFSVLPSPILAAEQTGKTPEPEAKTVDEPEESDNSGDNASTDEQDKTAADKKAKSTEESVDEDTSKESSAETEQDSSDANAAENDENATEEDDATAAEEDNTESQHKEDKTSESKPESDKADNSAEEDKQADVEQDTDETEPAEETEDDPQATSEEETEEQEQTEEPSTIQTQSIDPVKESISKLGHLSGSASNIYKKLGDESSAVNAEKYKDAVYYIKEQAKLRGDLYFKISKEPSRTKGVVGWVKASNMSTHSHVTIGEQDKTFYIKGSGNAYAKAWGGSKDYVYDLSNYEGQAFKVHLTEKVGNNVWYRGTLDGKTVWAHNSYVKEKVPEAETSKTSKLGHLKGNATDIYKQLGDDSSVISAKQYKDAVYYIKEQAQLDGDHYYKISKQPSSSEGVVGWVKTSDMSTHAHVGKDKKDKTFYIKGSGNAYAKAWGGSKDHVYDLSNYENHTFKVHLTEKVGSNVWYRGELDGKTVWAHNSFVQEELSFNTSKTSRLGHLRSSATDIYQTLGDESSVKDAEQFKDAVYYIKEQAQFGDDRYYKISEQPSSSKGVLGWVKASDMSTHAHKGVDKYSKQLYLTGEGKGYSKAWGGSKDLAYDLSDYRNQSFKVNLTEKVGNNIWYRGTLDGKTVWAHSSYVMPTKPTNTSKLGHISGGKVKIYPSLTDLGTYKQAGDKYTNAVYYIKSEASVGGDTFYLISQKPSNQKGVIGWVKASDMSTHSHVGKDKKDKTFYIKGSGNAYAKAWGGSNDLIYDLSNYEGQAFKVHLTEEVGNNVWYRGKLDGKTVWAHNSYVQKENPIEISKTSKLGHLRGKASNIYETLGDESSAIDADKYKDAVYYIKEQANVFGEDYYKISEKPSKNDGIVGWVKADDMSTHAHVNKNKKAQSFYIEGSGKAYSKPWGGSKNLVYDLSKYKEEEFNVNQTDKVGDNNTWFKGKLDGKMVWIHKSYVTGEFTDHTQYDLTLDKSVDMQMNANAQTDKYRNEPAYVSSKYVDFTKKAVINNNGVRLRTSPSLNGKIHKTVNRGTEVIVKDTVKGDEYAGSVNWNKIKYDGKTLYVHASLVNSKGATAVTTADDLNIRAKANTDSHIYDTVKKGTKLNVIEIGSKWYKISYGTWRNPTKSEIKYQMNPDNFADHPLLKYQFMELKHFTDVPASELRGLLAGKGKLNGTEGIFRSAAKNAGINEIYLINHAVLETGNGKSELAKGVKYKDKTVYNFFGIGAYDNCAVDCGAKRAYEEGWFTPEEAIIGGAKFAGGNYINNGQSTLYDMRWNPKHMENNGRADHQYATDIGWAGKQVSNYNDFYSDGHYNLKFDIPVYK